MVTAVARPIPPADGTAPGWRLTRRGRVVLAALVALSVMTAVAVASVAVGGGTAQATGHAMSARAADRNLARVTVHSGQSLWSVAEAADPDADTRLVIQQIIELNALSGMTVNPGEQLWVPRG